MSTMRLTRRLICTFAVSPLFLLLASGHALHRLRGAEPAEPFVPLLFALWRTLYVYSPDFGK